MAFGIFKENLWRNDWIYVVVLVKEVLARLPPQVFSHPQHPLVDIICEFTRNGQGDDNVWGDAKTFRVEVV